MIRLSETMTGQLREFDGVELARHCVRKGPNGIAFTIFGIKQDVSFVAALRTFPDDAAPAQDDEGRELAQVILSGTSLEALRVEIEIWLEHHLSIRYIEAAREAVRHASKAVLEDPSGTFLPGLYDGAARKAFEALSPEQQRHALDPAANHL